MSKKYVLIEGKSFQKARNSIKKTPSEKRIIFSGISDELNRKILEKEKINVLLINQKNRKDFLKQRDSGFNHVLARIAREKEVDIGINLDEIVEADKKEKSEIIGRIIQNIMLCRKKEIKMHFISRKNIKKDLYGLKALGLVLGMPTWMTKKLEFIRGDCIEIGE